MGSEAFDHPSRYLELDRIWRVPRDSASLDDLVVAGEQCSRYRKLERFGPVSLAVV
jgi:hypothetical protein